MNIVIFKLAEVLALPVKFQKQLKFFQASPGLPIGLSTNFSQLGPAVWPELWLTYNKIYI